MNDTADTITIPRAEYDRMIERIEDLEDNGILDRAEAEAAAGLRNYLPAALVKRMIAGETPLRLWREHRGLTLKALGEKAGIAPGYVSEIETGKKPGSIDAWKALAKALRVKVDDLVD